MRILCPLKVQERGNAKAQRKTLEIGLFVHHTIWIHPFAHLVVTLTMLERVLETPKEGFVSAVTLMTLALKHWSIEAFVVSNCLHVFKRSFPSYSLPLFQNESMWKTIQMELTLIYVKMYL